MGHKRVEHRREKSPDCVGGHFHSAGDAPGYDRRRRARKSKMKDPTGVSLSLKYKVIVTFTVFGVGGVVVVAADIRAAFFSGRSLRNPRVVRRGASIKIHFRPKGDIVSKLIFLDCQRQSRKKRWKRFRAFESFGQRSLIQPT